MYVCPLELKTLACLDFILYEISAFYSWKSFVTIFSKSFFSGYIINGGEKSLGIKTDAVT